MELNNFIKMPNKEWYQMVGKVIKVKLIQNPDTTWLIETYIKEDDKDILMRCAINDENLIIEKNN